MYDEMYDDFFDHLMHYCQVMTLDIRNDELFCKVFPISIQDPTLAWFHHLTPNSIHTFWEMSEAFVAYYLCLTR